MRHAGRTNIDFCWGNDFPLPCLIAGKYSCGFIYNFPD